MGGEYTQTEVDSGEAVEAISEALESEAIDESTAGAIAEYLEEQGDNITVNTGTVEEVTESESGDLTLTESTKNTFQTIVNDAATSVANLAIDSKILPETESESPVTVDIGEYDSQISYINITIPNIDEIIDQINAIIQATFKASSGLTSQIFTSTVLPDNVKLEDAFTPGATTDRAAKDAEADGVYTAFTVDTGDGDDTVETGAGLDSIVGGAGNDSIMSGAGADSVLAGNGQDSIDAGSGVDFVNFSSASAANVEITVDDATGTVVVRDLATDNAVSAQNADYIELADGAAIINAADRGDGTAGRLVSSEVGEFGYAEYSSAFELDDEDGNIDLVAFAEDLLEQTDLDSLRDADFIEALYQGTFGRSVDPKGLDFYLSALETGDKSRAEVFADLGWSDEGVDSNDNVNEIDGMV